MPTDEPRRSNTIGMVGFILVIFATLFSPTGFCGLPLLILVPAGFAGLILCAVGLFDRPRWPAVSGLIIGILCVGGWGAFFGTLFYQAYSHAAKFGMNIGQHSQMSMAAMSLFEAAEAQRQSDNLPARSFSFTPVAAEYLSDPWSHPYRYVLTVTPRRYTFMSDGPDGIPNTADDIDLAAIQQDDMFALPPFRTPAAGAK